MTTASTRNVTLSNADKISLIGNLATMLSAGIPIMEAVESLLDGAKGNTKKILEALKADLMQGKRVYLSLSAFPKVFDSVTTNLIHASEEAGTLEITLKDLREHIQKDAEFMDKVKLAMLYPLFIMGVFVFVLLVILVFVTPKIATVFGRLNVTLPLPTKVLIYSSNLLTQHTLVVVLVIAGLLGFISLIFRYQRPVVLNILFSLPLISRLIREIDLTRFSRSMYLLLASGLPITQTLQLSQDVVFRRQTKALISRCREMVLSGKHLAEGLKTAKDEIPVIMQKLVEAGEKTGTLDKSMQDISVYLDYQVSNTLKTVTSVLEPVMLLIVALSVGSMMMAVIAPIYGLISQVGGGA